MSNEELNLVRHENNLVLLSFRQLPNLTRAQRAARLGMGEFRLVLILRRLERTGLL